MTEARLALSELLEKAGDGDFLRTVAEAALQSLMEAKVRSPLGAMSEAASARPGAMVTATAKAAIRRTFAATWQRCRVHWMRNALSYVAKTAEHGGGRAAPFRETPSR